MRAPAHWFTPPANPGLVAGLFRPLGALYAAATAWRLRRGIPYQARVPVICIGNLNAGGAGKTPTVIALAQRYGARGIVVHVVSRGHGGQMKGPVQVDPDRHSARDVGDEPLLIAAFVPTWVARDRAAGVQAAQAAGAGVILLDDGFQNPSVAKTAAIIVVDAGIGFGNGLCIPAGPLREPVEVGLLRADMIMSIGDPDAQARFRSDWGDRIRVPVVTAALVPLATGMSWPETRVLAFAGIGRPEKFFATLRATGANLVATQALDDHQPLSEPLLRRLEADALALGAQLVTTEKDAMRLPAAFRNRVLTFPVRLVPDDWTAIDALISAV